MLMNYHIGRLVLSSLCVGAFGAGGFWWCSFCRRQPAKRLLVIAHKLHRVGFMLCTLHKISASRFFCNELKDGYSQDALNCHTYLTVLAENVLSALGLKFTTLNEIKRRTIS